jgi:ketosteroid isomerase-like protein
VLFCTLLYFDSTPRSVRPLRMLRLHSEYLSSTRLSARITLTLRATQYKNLQMTTTPNAPLHLAQEFLRSMGTAAEPSEIASLFSDTMEWEIAGDTGVLPWIGKKSGKSAILDFITDSRAILERISFEIRDILANDARAVILGTLASRLKSSGKIINTDFAIVLTVANGEIVRFQMLEDSFAVSKAART